MYGGEFQRVDFEGLEIADDQSDERILAIDEALKRLFTNMTQAERDELLAELRGETVE